MVQLVTVIITGARYLLRHQTEVGTPGHKVHCWGEVKTVKGNLGTVHYDGKVFRRSAVEIKEVPKTAALLMDLWQQMVANRRAEGHTIRVSKTGRTAKDYGKIGDK